MELLSVEQIAEMAQDNLVILVGPPAAGKDTLMNKVLELGVYQLISHTTRPMRPGEVDGKEYYFVSEEEFMKHDMLEYRKYTTVHGVWYYGLSSVEGVNNGITIMDYPGFKEAKEWRDNKGLNTIAVLVDIDKETARERYGKRDGDYAEFDRRWEADLWWVEEARKFEKFAFED